MESVWDYPRPPRIENSESHVLVILGGRIIADSTNSVRVLETSQPPTYYVPRQDVIFFDKFTKSSSTTLCEFKGNATYWDINLDNDTIIKDAAWSYENPTESFSTIRGYLAFYAAKMEWCYLDNELVNPQDSSYYGGWVTSNIKGPFKLISGTKDSDWRPAC